jgi:FKBP-type peptidyl-prolyl cis-trans isomerase SlyD
MEEKIKKGDFIEVDYTGRVEGNIFDTTDEKTAKKLGIFNPTFPYGRIIVCVGEGHLLKGLDKEIEGREIGKEYIIKLGPESAFGKKDASLIKLIPQGKFKSQGVEPKPGMTVNIDNRLAVIKSAGGGRVLVDFNHPLAGKEVEYTIKATKKITNTDEQVAAIIIMELNLNKDAYEFKIEGENAKLRFKKDLKLPKEFQQEIARKIENLTQIKKVNVED